MNHPHLYPHATKLYLSKDHLVLFKKFMNSIGKALLKIRNGKKQYLLGDLHIAGSMALGFKNYHQMLEQSQNDQCEPFQFDKFFRRLALNLPSLLNVSREE